LTFFFSLMMYYITIFVNKGEKIILTSKPVLSRRIKTIATNKFTLFAIALLCLLVGITAHFSSNTRQLQEASAQHDTYDAYEYSILSSLEIDDFVDFSYGLDYDGAIAITEVHYILVDYERENIECDITFIGTEIVVVEGVPGVEAVEIVSEVYNGVQVASEVGNRSLVVPPQNLQVIVGTRDSAYVPSGVMIWPLDRPVSSGFGNRVVLGRSEFHSGIDIPAPTGTPIVAADAGTVVFAASRGNFGLLLVICHGDGLYTYYAHLSRFGVTVGQEVRQGQTIGYVGTTGRVTGPHLHFEVVQGGRRLNPMNFLPRR